MFKMNWIDLTVILAYFVSMIAIGVSVMRKASKNLDACFPAGNALPWWVLGISNASAMWAGWSRCWKGEERTEAGSWEWLKGVAWRDFVVS